MKHKRLLGGRVMQKLLCQCTATVRTCDITLLWCRTPCQQRIFPFRSLHEWHPWRVATLCFILHKHSHWTMGSALIFIWNDDSPAKRLWWLPLMSLELIRKYVVTRNYGKISFPGPLLIHVIRLLHLVPSNMHVFLWKHTLVSFYEIWYTSRSSDCTVDDWLPQPRKRATLSFFCNTLSCLVAWEPHYSSTVHSLLPLLFSVYPFSLAVLTRSLSCVMTNWKAAAYVDTV